MFNIDRSGFFSDMKNTTRNNKVNKFKDENPDPESFRKAIAHNIKLARLESGIIPSLNLKKAITNAAKSTVNKQAKLNALISSRDDSTSMFSYAKNSVMIAMEKKKLNLLSKLYKNDNMNSKPVLVNNSNTNKTSTTDNINKAKESYEDDENTEEFRYKLLKEANYNNDLTEKTNKLLDRLIKTTLLSGGSGLGLGGLGLDLDGSDRRKSGKTGKGKGKLGKGKLGKGGIRTPGIDIPEPNSKNNKVDAEKTKPNNSPDNKSKTIDKKGGKVDISGNSKVNIDIDKPSSKFGKIGSMLKKGVKFIPGIGMVAALGTAGYSAFKGFTDDASSITGIDEENLTTLDKTMSGLSAVIEDLSFGLLKSEDTFNFFNSTTADISNTAENLKDSIFGDNVKEESNYDIAPVDATQVDSNYKTSGNFKDDVKRNTRFLETSKYEGNYAKTGDIGDNAGISFGAYQLTEKSGGVQDYIKRMAKYDPEAAAINENYKGTSKQVISDYLKKSGNTEQGRAVQDKIYDEKYYQPVMKLAAKKGITNEASIAQMLDHHINTGKASRMLDFADSDYSPESIAQARRDHYQAIADHDSSKKKYLKNWNNRVTQFDKNFAGYKNKNINEVTGTVTNINPTPEVNLPDGTLSDNVNSTGNAIDNEKIDGHIDIIKNSTTTGGLSQSNQSLANATYLPDMSNNGSNKNNSPIMNNQNNASSNSSVVNNNIIQPDNSFGISSNLSQYLKA